MRLRRWGAVAAAALVVAGCGTSVSGQAVPAVPNPSSSQTTTTSSLNSSTSLSLTPFPDSSTAATTDSSSTSNTATTSTMPTGRQSTTAPTTPSTTAGPSTTVKWLVPLPKAGTPKVNKFGNVIATPGKPFAVVWTRDKQISVVFIVDSLQVDRGCEATVKPKNGHLLVISIRAQLGNATGDELSKASIGFTDDYWTVFDAKDTAQVGTDTPASSDCLTYKTQLPYASDMKPDKVYSGKIAVDVAAATGTAVLMNSLDGGWVYSYG